MFCDITRITVQAGSGGNGCVSAHRAKFLEFGGPDGGNGGKGGDFIIRVNPHLNSLIDLHLKKSFKAEIGGNGKGKNQNGKNGDDFILEVPQGTIIKNLDNGDVFDLFGQNDEILIAKGGRGGYGNAHFKSSTRQFPEFAENGEPTDEINLEVELKLVADVGIIGIPSAGKSTLIGKITNLKPKIADYPFTTLIPNIGVAKIFDNSLVFADIPGLIEGASEGRGLGTEFLRHISRNAVLVHLLDGNSFDIFKDFETVQNEIKKYSEQQELNEDSDEKTLFDKPQIIVINKVDLLDDDSLELIKKDFIAKCLKNKKIHNFKTSKQMQDSLLVISAVTGEGIKEFLSKIWNVVLDNKKKKTKKIDAVEANKNRILYEPHLEEGRRYFELKLLDEKIKNGKRIFEVRGKRIEQIARMTNFSQEGGVIRLYDVLIKLGIKNAIIKAGGQNGDMIRFGDWPEMLTFKEGD